MKYVREQFDIQYDALHKKERDAVNIVVGEEGDGKSHFCLNVLEYWLEKKYSEIKGSDIKFMNLDIELWAKSLSEAEKGDMNIYDEAGEVAGRRTMSKLNVAIARTYQIIRADCLNSILVLPDLFWLDGTFTKRRAKGLWYVYQRGRVAYWNRDQLRKIMDLNARRTVKSLWVVRPLFFDTFPIYKGKLKAKYEELKHEFMKDTRKDLLKIVKEIKGETKISERDSIIMKLKSKFSSKDIAEATGLAERTINHIVLKAKQTASE